MTQITPEKIDVGGLAAVVNSQLGTESRIAIARGLFWCCAGVASAFLLSGAGLALAFYGYSYAFSAVPATQQTAKAFVEAIERTDIKTSVSGTMTIAPTSMLRLSPGQTIKIDEAAFVKLDPRSTVRIVGDLKIDAPQPSKEQLQLDTSNTSAQLPFTTYTIFRSVGHGDGQVVTGWNYYLSDTIRPRAQYCYYTEKISGGLAAKYTLAFNGHPRQPSTLTKLSFDFDAALTNCIWFSGL